MEGKTHFDGRDGHELNLIGKTILIVDDVDDNSELFSFYLEETGANLLFANNGEAAIAICRKGPSVDLVLMDVQMPLTSGLDATREIRKFNQKLPIIAVSAYTFSGDRQCCLEVGCNEFLTKPIDSEELFRTIRKQIL